VTVSDSAYGGTWCERCDLPRNMCEHSVDKAVLAAFDNRHVVRSDLVADGPTIDATQDTPCPGCTGRIVPGERITHTEYGWAHERHVDPGERDHTGNAVDWGDLA
jgi:hypothetical protein